MDELMCSEEIVHSEVVENVKKKLPSDDKIYDLAELFKVLQEWRYAYVVVKMCRKNRGKKRYHLRNRPKENRSL